MITLYVCDSMGIYAYSQEFDPFGAVPPMSTEIAPPATTEPEVAQWSGSSWVVLPKRPDTPPPVAPSALISVLAFRNRFTAAEKAAIELGAVHDPSAIPAAQLQAATIRAYLADLLAAKHIELGNEDTQGGVVVLEQWGYLAPGRAEEIIASDVQPHELP